MSAEALLDEDIDTSYEPFSREPQYIDANRAFIETLGLDPSMSIVGAPHPYRIFSQESPCGRFVGGHNGGWKTGCEEWQELNKSYQAYLAAKASQD